MKNMNYYKSLSIEEIKNLIPNRAILFFDTESCFVNENKDIPIRILNKINPLFNTEVHVYAWAIANDMNDNVIFGINLKEFTDFLFDLQVAWFNDRIYTQDEFEKLALKIEIWVHNLQWDLEFLKYELEKQKYTYENSKVNKCKEKIHKKIMRGHYYIVENTGVVYASQVTHKKAIKVTVSKNKELVTMLSQINISFHDSLKVTNASLDDIAKNLLTLPPERLKIDGYDYDRHRPIGYMINEEEQEYLYNDVFILKEWYNQYYETLNTSHKTSSSIAFERICKLTWGENFNYKKDFLTNFPDIYNYTAKDLINDSYSGGITQVNRFYNNEIQYFNENKVSLDIVSSYPSILVSKPLPIGNAIISYDFELNEEVRNNKLKYIAELEKYKAENKLVLYKIAFDGFKNKDPNNLIGEIQIGSHNKEEFQQYFKNINSGKEYIHTNIIDNNTLIGGNNKHNSYRYVKTYWNFELDSILKNTTFYIGEQKYCPDREFYYYPDTLELTENYIILSASVFNSQIGFFKDGILDGYNKKNEGKKTGNKILEYANKIFINSFYGKLATNPERRERYSYYNEEKELMEYEKTNIVYYDNKKYYKVMATCITAWGRCNLRDTLYQVCNYNPATDQITTKFHNNVMYMDTDSLYTTLNVTQLKKILGSKINSTLGSWSLESEYNQFKAIGSKKYMFNGRKINTSNPFKISCKCAGLPKEARETQNFNTFYLGAVITGKKVKQKVKGGYALIYGNYTICDNIL